MKGRRYSFIGPLAIIIGIIMLYHHSSNQNNITLITDPKVLAINVVETHEALVDLKDQKTIAYGPSPEIPNNSDYTFLRKSVYEKLKQAQALLPAGLHFCLYEGYRSLSLQKKLFDDRFNKIKKLFPTWPDDKVFIETTTLVSPVMNQDGSTNVPPHSTGSAIDVYLINDQGDAIEMGIHPKDWMDDTHGALSLTLSKAISIEAQHNRKIMGEALSAVGFINYPTEYWHWSYGDRYWAYYEKKPYAIYGTVKR